MAAMSFDYRGTSDAKNNAAVDPLYGGSWIRSFARFSRKRCLLGLCSVFCAALPSPPLIEANAQPAELSPLQLETKIALGDVRGRIDHMAVDLKRQRLFVSELGNDSVGVVDLANRKLLQTITGLKEPQGVGYDPSTDMLYVANAGDGSVRLFDGMEYKPKGQIELGSDADNVRVDPTANRIFVGYGSGALAVIDPATRRKVGDIPVKAHPEGFQIDHDTGQIFVNVPDAHGIAIVDRTSEKQTGKWPIPDHSANFPMAIDPVRRQVLVIFRAPAELGVFSTMGGRLIATADTCGDADDLFIDAKRGRVYVSCGEGFLDVLEAKGTTYRRTARIPTVSGARTSLFVPELDRLLVAVRSSTSETSAIWMFRPIP
jgi:YVTN family beta-propeller protein